SERRGGDSGRRRDGQPTVMELDRAVGRAEHTGYRLLRVCALYTAGRAAGARSDAGRSAQPRAAAGRTRLRGSDESPRPAAAPPGVAAALAAAQPAPRRIGKAFPRGRRIAFHRSLDTGVPVVPPRLRSGTKWLSCSVPTSRVANLMTDCAWEGGLA